MFIFYENNKIANVTNFPYLDKSWNQPEIGFDTYIEANIYARNWMGAFDTGEFELEKEIEVYGSIFVIREK